MHEFIVSRLKGLKFGEPQTHKSIVIFPLMNGQEAGPDYITLAQALEDKVLAVTEVSEGGSVPELKVTNSADMPVLLLDGEEVAGAKQNRVLNTTVLVQAKQTIVIPVSCTEQGRWSYATSAFYDSGTVMSHSLRAKKSRSVSESLSASASFRSNQGEVWDGISELQAAAGAPSPTSSMRDVFESRHDSLEEAMRAFPLMPGQVGVLAVVRGAAVGFDVVSRPAAYGRLHGKLIKSYVMEALLGGRAAKADVAAAAGATEAFVERAVRCEEKTFKSVGCGDDYRFKGGRIAGSALMHEGVVVHAAFFEVDAAIEDGRMSSMARRRAYRVQ